MAGYETLMQPNDTNVNSLNNTSQGQDVMNCNGASLPGIVSNDTAIGLDNFYNKYRSIHGYVAIAVCLFGVLSNSANIIVLTRKNMSSSTNTLLMWLAVSDLLTMLSYLPFAVHFYVMDPLEMAFASPDFAWICLLLFHASFSMVCHTIAIWLTIALAIFRYIYICKPTSGAYYCSQRRARFVVILVIILTIIVCAPNYVVNTYVYHPNNDPSAGQVSQAANISSPTKIHIAHLDNSSTSFDQSTSANPNLKENTGFYTPSYRPVYELVRVNYWIQAILVKLVPCFMLTTLTLLLVHAMHKAYRKRLKLKSQGRKTESDRNSEHNRVTNMLLAVVILFTITELPQGILALMNIFLDCFYKLVYEKLGDLLDIMALINNSINFVLYCIMSTQFRNTFIEIFWPFKGKVKRPKWFKLRLIKTTVANKSNIEAFEENGTNDSGKQNNNVARNGSVSQPSGPTHTTPLNSVPSNPLETDFPVSTDSKHAQYGSSDETAGNSSDLQPLTPENV